MENNELTAYSVIEELEQNNGFCGFDFLLEDEGKDYISIVAKSRLIQPSTNCIIAYMIQLGGYKLIGENIAGLGTYSFTKLGKVIKIDFQYIYFEHKE